MPGVQLPWNEEFETLLLHCVLVKGSHICGGKKVSQSWSEVNDIFYEQDLLADYEKITTRREVFAKFVTSTRPS